jgi:hypothetical protein
MTTFALAQGGNHEGEVGKRRAAGARRHRYTGGAQGGRPQHFSSELEVLRLREKAHTREGDAIAAARWRLPMVEVEPTITLIGPHGPVSLLDASSIGARSLSPSSSHCQSGLLTQAAVDTHLLNQAHWYTRVSRCLALGRGPGLPTRQTRPWVKRHTSNTRRAGGYSLASRKSRSLRRTCPRVRWHS